MNATTLFLVGLFLLVACAVFAGEAVSRFGQLPMVGQLAVGILFGPTLLGPALGLQGLPTAFAGIQVLATFFILMAAGLTVTPEQVRSTGVWSAILGITIFFVPFAAGAFLVHYLYPGLSTYTALFVSLTISITALPVLGVMLREFNLLKSRFGAYLLNGAMVNELIAVTTFAILLRLRTGGAAAFTSIAAAVLAVLLFLLSVLAVYVVIRVVRRLPAGQRLAHRFRSSWHSREAGFAILMVAALGAALYSQYLGITYLIGAFYAGLLVKPESAGHRFYKGLTQVFDTLTWGFFIPLFFALVGLSMDLRLIGDAVVPLAAFAALCVFAFFAKVGLGGSVSRALGWSPNESLAAGFLVASRGAVELAMAVTLLSLGILTPTLFTIVAAVGLVTTFLSPIGARPFVRAIPKARIGRSGELGEFPVVPLTGPDAGRTTP